MTLETPLLKITSLRVDYPCLKSDKPYPGSVPFCIVNATFKIRRDCDDGQMLWDLAVGQSKDYARTTVTDDPEKEVQWYANALSFEDGKLIWPDKYPGMEKKWTMQDPSWQYIEKFDTFWFREWVAYSSVTVALISEISVYKVTGKLRYSYRALEESIVLKHFETLGRYWD